jgi:hypothetical protein
VTVESFRGFAGDDRCRDRLPRQHRRRSVGVDTAGIVAAGSNPRDLAIIFGVFTGVIGVTGTFLFVQESASRASRASERANAAGVVTGRRTE